jgi:putative transcriptional regulator
MQWRLTAAFFVASFAVAFGQGDQLAAGKFLVASRELGDPNFAEAVILLLQYDAEQGSMGLIVNRKTDLPLSRVFQDLKEAKGRTDPVYIGGPVELTTVLGLLRSSVKPADAKRAFGDVYLINSRDQLLKILGAGAEPDVFHVFVGYAGWGPGQLEHEVELDAWHIMAAEAGMVFHANPETVWMRLIRRTEQQIASAGAWHAGYSARSVSSGSNWVARRAGK